MYPKRKPDEVKPRASVLPLIIGPANAEAATGFPWRWCRDTAVALGVPRLGHNKKGGIRADLFVAALEKNGVAAVDVVEKTTTTPSITPADPVAYARALLGKKLKAVPR